MDPINKLFNSKLYVKILVLVKKLKKYASFVFVCNQAIPYGKYYYIKELVEASFVLTFIEPPTKSFLKKVLSNEKPNNMNKTVYNCFISLMYDIFSQYTVSIAYYLHIWKTINALFLNMPQKLEQRHIPILYTRLMPFGQFLIQNIYLPINVKDAITDFYTGCTDLYRNTYDLNLSFVEKVLLTGAYLACNNPARTDRKNFSIKPKRNKITKINTIRKKQNYPRAVDIRRIRLITDFFLNLILRDPFRDNNTIEFKSGLNNLVQQKHLKVNMRRYDNAIIVKYKTLVNHEFAVKISESIGIRLYEYLERGSL